MAVLTMGATGVHYSHNRGFCSRLAFPGGEYEIEIRQVFEASDFETMTPELREQEERLRATIESRRGSS
jgi:hypothetical protein